MALFRETDLLHLYTVESNYNTVRTPGTVPPCSGDPDGRASPPSGRRPTPRLTPDLLQVDHLDHTEGASAYFEKFSLIVQCYPQSHNTLMPCLVCLLS